MSVRVYGISRVRRKLSSLPNLVNRAVDKGLRKVAMHTLRAVVKETPKGYTGQTRRSWRAVQFGSAGTMSGWVVSNDSKVMRFLEFGTKSHGPTTARKLFIPLRRGVALGGYKKGMKFGKDFILAKRVRGIAPKKIVEKRRRIAKRQAGLVIAWTIQEIKKSWG